MLSGKIFSLKEKKKTHHPKPLTVWIPQNSGQNLNYLSRNCCQGIRGKVLCTPNECGLCLLQDDTSHEILHFQAPRILYFYPARLLTETFLYFYFLHFHKHKNLHDKKRKAIHLSLITCSNSFAQWQKSSLKPMPHPQVFRVAVIALVSQSNCNLWICLRCKIRISGPIWLLSSHLGLGSD